MDVYNFVSVFQIPFIAMYRKEECLSLLKDHEDDNKDKSEITPTLKWHKVNAFNMDQATVETSNELLLIRNGETSH